VSTRILIFSLLLLLNPENNQCVGELQSVSSPLDLLQTLGSDDAVCGVPDTAGLDLGSRYAYTLVRRGRRTDPGFHVVNKRRGDSVSIFADVILHTLPFLPDGIRQDGSSVLQVNRIGPSRGG